MKGIINVCKEPGYTSHDVVAKLRGILKMKKIGHTGTLDPDARGVLPVCLGSATKVCELLTEKQKTYETTLLLGVETDTQDSSGTVIREQDVHVTLEELRSVIEGFQGEIWQLPPMYSACKVQGKRLYELAREGKTVERKKRKIFIYELEIKKIDLPRVEMKVTCSKGTYIRTLCHDIGQACGCGGCMEHLVRTRVDCFTLQEAKTLSEIEQWKAQGRLLELITPIDRLFQELPSFTVRPGFEKYVINGNPLRKEWMDEPFLGVEEQVRIYDETKSFIGIYHYEEENQWVRPVKRFL